MATNFVKASYTEIIDLQTVNGKVSIVGIHTPTGTKPYNKLKGFFLNFRKYKYLGISKMIMAPAAELPVDPLGLTGVEGTTDLMDPRDMLNPILFHGCHGESMSEVIDRFYVNNGTGANALTRVTNPTAGFVSDSADKVDYVGPQQSGLMPPAEQTYYRLLTDPTWKKFGIQSPVVLKKLHPLTWRVNRTSPLLPTAFNPGNGQVLTSTGGVGNPVGGVGTSNTPFNLATNAPVESAGVDGSSGASVPVAQRPFVQEFTSGVSPLGWLPTTHFAYEPQSGDVLANCKPSITILPKLFMGMLVLPPAYNKEQFFRLSIRHNFAFRDFTASLGGMDPNVLLPDVGVDDATKAVLQNTYYNWIDYGTSDGKAKVTAQSVIDEGSTLDSFDAQSEVISDGVN